MERINVIEIHEATTQSSFPYSTGSIGVVLAKPTKRCNADCSYCFAPEISRDSWDIAGFKKYFTTLLPFLGDNVEWIWHGGEPMLMGAEFFKEAEKFISDSTEKNFKFSMQSNLTMYSNEKWLPYIKDNIKSRISTSYDVGSKDRTINGCSKTYQHRFTKSLVELMEKDIHPYVISVVDDNNIDQIGELYKMSQSLALDYGRGFDFRINPKINPHGSGSEDVFMLTPSEYGNKLVELLHLWIKDTDNDIKITPLDSYINFFYGYRDKRPCPWSTECAGAFISIEPNGDIYQCDDMVHYFGEKYKIGNLNNLRQINRAKPEPTIYANKIECYSCEYFNICPKGCGAITLLAQNNDIQGYPYCQTNKIVFKELEKLNNQGYEKILKKLAK